MVSILSNSEIEANLSNCEGWSLVNEERKYINKSFKFSNFSEAIAFMIQSAFVAEKIDHHPEWSNVYNKVDIVLTTHDIGGLSDKDMILAQEMNSIAKNLNASSPK